MHELIVIVCSSLPLSSKYIDLRRVLEGLVDFGHNSGSLASKMLETKTICEDDVPELQWTPDRSKRAATSRMTLTSSQVRLR